MNSEISKSNKSIVWRFNKEFLEQGNLEVLEEIVAEDFINHTASGSMLNNREGLKQFVSMLHQGFSDFEVEIHDQVEENDLIATRKTIRAKHSGPIMGLQASAKTVEFNIMDFVRIRNGKYSEHWGQNNILQVIQSLKEE